MNSLSFDYQINNHKTSLQHFAMNFTKNSEDANDLVQDTMLKALRYSDLYREGTNLRGWLFTIMRNTFINNYRRLAKRQDIMDTTEDLSSYQLKNSASGNQGENKLMMEDIQKALGKLQPEYYVPFIKYFEGYKYHEIADELGIPIGTVKTRIHLARQVLKNNLKVYSSEFKKSNKYA